MHIQRKAHTCTDQPNGMKRKTRHFSLAFFVCASSALPLCRLCCLFASSLNICWAAEPPLCHICHIHPFQFCLPFFLCVSSFHHLLLDLMLVILLMKYVVWLLCVGLSQKKTIVSYEPIITRDDASKEKFSSHATHTQTANAQTAQQCHQRTTYILLLGEGAKDDPNESYRTNANPMKSDINSVFRTHTKQNENNQHKHFYRTFPKFVARLKFICVFVFWLSADFLSNFISWLTLSSAIMVKYYMANPANKTHQNKNHLNIGRRCDV